MLTVDRIFQKSAAVFWEVVPASLFRPGLTLSAPQTITVSELPLTAQARQALFILGKTRQSVNIKLDGGFILRKTIALPKAAASFAEKAITLQLRQTMPAQASGLVWRFSQGGTRGGMTDYFVSMLKQSQLDSLLEEAALLGVKVQLVTLSDKACLPLFQGDSFKAATRNKWVIGTAGIVVLISLAQVVILERAVATLELGSSSRADQLQQDEAALLAAKETAESASNQKSRIAQDISLFKDQAHPLDALIDLTNTLPDSVWISELNLSGGQMALSGFTTLGVPELIVQIQGIPWATHATLAGPAAVDGYSGQTRFDIVIPLTSEASQP